MTARLQGASVGLVPPPGVCASECPSSSECSLLNPTSVCQVQHGISSQRRVAKRGSGRDQVRADAGCLLLGCGSGAPRVRAGVAPRTCNTPCNTHQRGGGCFIARVLRDGCRAARQRRIVTALRHPVARIPHPVSDIGHHEHGPCSRPSRAEARKACPRQGSVDQLPLLAATEAARGSTAGHVPACFPEVLFFLAWQAVTEHGEFHMGESTRSASECPRWWRGARHVKS